MQPVETILVPIDFEAASLAAVHAAVEMARPLDARVVLLHVYSLPPYAYRGLPEDIFRRLREQASHEALRPLNDLASRWQLRALLREGDPVEHILRAVDEVGAQRIVMGTHGRRGLDRLLLGSVAEAIVRNSPVPVMTVRAVDSPRSVEARPRSVLCAVDLEPASEQVVALARQLADEQSTSLELLHVYSAPFYVYPAFDPVLAGELDVEVRRAATKAMDALAKSFGATRCHLRSGPFGKRIVEATEEMRPAVLVLGTHGRRALSRTFLGSVAEWVLRRSTVPVVTARLEPASVHDEDSPTIGAAAPDRAAAH
jgi:nucleotide-binding universal stress UspA family protein